MLSGETHQSFASFQSFQLVRYMGYSCEDRSVMG